MTEKHATPGHRITEVWMFIVVDEDGDEALPAFHGPNNTALPMVCTDQARVDSLRAMAAALSREYGVRVELIHFGGAREVLETWGGRTGPR